MIPSHMILQLANFGDNPLPFLQLCPIRFVVDIYRQIVADIVQVVDYRSDDDGPAADDGFVTFYPGCRFLSV
jgi:hypothetical protein